MLYIPRGWAHQAHTHTPFLPSSSGVAALSPMPMPAAASPPTSSQPPWPSPEGSSMHITFGLEVEACMSWQGLLHFLVAHICNHIVCTPGSNVNTILNIRVCQ
ncbi:hypothetical protein DUNSADRAFT_7710, partial [Dunaliella salina]